MSWRLRVNLFAPVWYAAGLWMAATGRVSWWVLLLVFLSHVEVKVPL